MYILTFRLLSFSGQGAYEMEIQGCSYECMMLMWDQQEP